MNYKKNNNNKIFIAYIFLLCFGLIITNSYAEPIKFTSSELSWLNSHPVISLAPDPNFPPLEYFENGKYSGFFSDYFSIIEQRLGIKLKIVQLKNWDDVIEAAKNRSVDGITAAQITPDRLKYLIYTNPIIDIPNVIITAGDSYDEITLEQLSGKKITITKGNAIHEFIKSKYPNVIIIPVKDDLTALKEVSFYKADATVVNLAIASYLIEKHGISNLRVTGDSGKSNPLAIAVRNDYPLLRDILQKTVNSISDREKKVIYEKWISLEKKDIWFSKKFRKTFITTALIISGFFLLVIIWNYLLHKQVTLKTKELKTELTQKIHAQSALKESEEQFRTIFDNALDGILVADAETKSFFLANNSICQMLGYTKKEILSLNITDIHPEKEIDKIKDLMEKQLKCEIKTASDIPVKRKDGTIFFTDINSSPITINEKKYLLGIFRDITLKKTLDEAIKKSEERYRILVELAADGILLGSSEGIIIGANSKICELSGYSQNELIGKNISILFNPEELKRVPFQYDLLKQGRQVINERFLTKKNGQTVIIEMNTKMMPDSTYQAIIRDISLRKKLEKELEYTQALLQTAFEQNPVPMALADSIEKKMKMCNPAAFKILGIEPEFKNKYIDTNMSDLNYSWNFSTEDGKLIEISERPLNQAISGKKIINKEYKIIRQDGSEKWALMYATPILNKFGDIIAGLMIFPDITDIKMQEQKINLINEQLTEVNKELKSLDIVKTNILSNISHELRTPLVAIRGFSELIIKIDNGVLTSIQKDYLTRIISNVDRLVNIINDLINFSRMEKGIDKLFYETFVFGDIINDSISLHSDLLKQKNISVKLVIPQEEICITCDKDKILQVINNLLSNAIKFSNKNGVINISASVFSDKSVEFKIQDFGIGIPDDKIEKIFERFYQIDSSSTRSYSGLGLGLSICKNIIELHSGIITVKSSLNKGSIFSFILPPVAHIEINNEKIISTDESQKKNGKHFFKSGLKRKSVLIIDDDNEILDFIEILLENENFNVIKCPNPKESFSILKNQEIDIILLDISMKDMSGIDVCKKIKSSESTKNIPVLIITARAENSVRQICFDSGANDILTKPFSNKELIKKIFDLLIKG